MDVTPTPAPTPHEQNVFWISVLFYTIFSGIGSIFIIVSVLVKFRNDSQSRNVMQLSIADLLLSVICLILCGYNLANGHLQEVSNFVCRFQPFITWYLMETSILWLVVISLNSYKIIFYRDPFSTKQEIAATIICWTLPIISAALPLNDGTIDETYGHRNGLWCSFDANHRVAQIINLLVYYIPAMFIICFCYGRIVWHVSSLGKLEQTGNLSSLKIKAQRKFFLYCLSYFVVWTPLTVCYIYEAAVGKFIPFWAEYISANLLHFQGVFNAILYGITEDVIQNFFTWLKSQASTFSKSSRSADLP